MEVVLFEGLFLLNGVKGMKFLVVLSCLKMYKGLVVLKGLLVYAVHRLA